MGSILGDYQSWALREGYIKCLWKGPMGGAWQRSSRWTGQGLKDEAGAPSVVRADRVVGLAAWVSGVWDTYLRWEREVGRGHRGQETLPAAPREGLPWG